MMLKQIEKSQSLITVSVLVLTCTLALLLKPTQVACIEKKEGEGSRQRNKRKTNKNFQDCNQHFLILSPLHAELNLLIQQASLIFLTKGSLELMLSNGVKFKSHTEWLDCLKCRPTGAVVLTWDGCMTMHLCSLILSLACCPVSPMYCGCSGHNLPPLVYVMQQIKLVDEHVMLLLICTCSPVFDTLMLRTVDLL